MTLIYRVENAMGGGVYMTGSARETIGPDVFSDEYHPSPWEDDGLDHLFDDHDREWRGKDVADWGDLRFGFASLDQLNAWFFRPEWRAKLGSAGNRIAIYEVHDVVHLGQLVEELQHLLALPRVTQNQPEGDNRPHPQSAHGVSPVSLQKSRDAVGEVDEPTTDQQEQVK